MHIWQRTYLSTAVCIQLIWTTFNSSTSDLLIGGLDSDAKVNQILGESISYAQDDQTWCVRRAQLHDAWRNLFHLFTISSWFSLIAVMMLLAIALHVLLKMRIASDYSENFSLTWLLSFGAFLSNISDFKYRGVTVNFIYVILLMYAILFGVLFSCTLISVLEHPRHHFQVNSVKSAYERGYRFTSGNVAKARIEVQGDEVWLSYSTFAHKLIYSAYSRVQQWYWNDSAIAQTLKYVCLTWRPIINWLLDCRDNMPWIIHWLPEMKSSAFHHPKISIHIQCRWMHAKILICYHESMS